MSTAELTEDLLLLHEAAISAVNYALASGREDLARELSEDFADAAHLRSAVAVAA